MSRKGNCLDNAVAENFIGHFKEEFLWKPPSASATSKLNSMAISTDLTTVASS